MKRVIQKLLAGAIVIAGSLFGTEAIAANVTLNENCTVHILNRNIQVQKDGTWVMPSVPSSMGKIRARATCIQNGVTHYGQTKYFTIIPNAGVEVGEVTFLDIESIPESISYQATSFMLTSGPGTTLNLKATAKYADGSTKDVTADPGMNYASSNPAIASVDSAGVVTAVANGNAIITARKDGRVAIASVRVSFYGADTDGDGIPDEVEIQLGLNPNDPIDAVEDQDNDGLTALEEFNLGTDIFKADTDGDGIADGVEVSGSNGFVSNPLLTDSDGDGLSDGLEIQIGSDPNDAASMNLSAAMVNMEVSPPTTTIVYNTINAEATKQLRVTGHLIDGTTIDLTPRSRGTTYTSADLSVVSLGIEDGLLFAGADGSTTITVSNGTFQKVISVRVYAFSPTVMSMIQMPGYANNVAVAGNFAYVAAGVAGLQVVDVSDPLRPVITGSIDTPGVAYDVKVNGSYVYIADGLSGVTIVDVSNSTAPVIASTLDTPGDARDITHQNGFVYVADRQGGLQVLDVRNPTAPVITGALQGLGNSESVDVEGNFAVVSDRKTLHAVNVSDPASPLLEGSHPFGSDWVGDIKIVSGIVYAAVMKRGYEVIDFTTPSAPAFITYGPGFPLFDGQDIDVVNDKAFIASRDSFNGIPIVNAVNPADPKFQDRVTLGNAYLVGGTGIDVTNEFVFLTAEPMVAQGYFGEIGNTYLLIAQHSVQLDDGFVAPTVSLTLPVGAVYCQGQPITLQASASDDIGVASVSYYINGELVGTSSAGGSYDVQYTIPADASGLTVRVLATDFAGNVGTGSDVTIPVVTNSPPSVTMTSPMMPASFSEGEVVYMTASATDAEGMARVDFMVDGVIVGSDDTFPYSFNYQLPYKYPAGGTAQLSAKAVDIMGATATAEVVTVSISPNPLGSAFLAPVTAAPWLTGDSIRVSATVSGNFVASRAELYLNGLPVASSTFGSGSYTLIFTPLSAGPTELFARIYDNLGNFIDSPISVFQVEWAPEPVFTSLDVEYFSPSAGMVSISQGSSIPTDSRISLAAQFENVKQVRFYENGRLIATRSVFRLGQTYYTPLIVGPATYVAEGIAADGRTVMSSSFSLNVVENLPPAITITSPKSGPFVEGVKSITLNAEVIDDYTPDFVEFKINNQYTYYVHSSNASGPNYTFKWNLPATVSAGSTLNIIARVADRNKGIRRYTSAVPVSVQVIAEPFTTVSGRVLDRSGAPVSGAVVTSDVSSNSVKTAADGTFTLSALPTINGPITVRARSVVNNYLLEARSKVLMPTLGGVASVGDIKMNALSLNDGVLDKAGVIYGVDALVDQSGNLHIVWGANDDHGEPSFLNYQMRGITGEVLIDKTVLRQSYDSDAPSIKMDDQGLIHLLTGFRREVEYSVINPALDDQNGNAADPAVITVTPSHIVSSNDNINSSGARLAIDSYGNIHAVWIDARVDVGSTGISSIRYLKIDGSNGTALSQEKQLAVRSQYAPNPQRAYQPHPIDVETDAVGGLHLIWSDSYTDPVSGAASGAIHYSMLDIATGFSVIAETIVNSGSVQNANCSMAVDAQNRVHMAVGDQIVEYLRLEPYAAGAGGNLIANSLVVDSKAVIGNSVVPVDISVDASNAAHLVWESERGRNSNSVNYQQVNETGAAQFAQPLVLRTFGQVEDTYYDALVTVINPVLNRLSILKGVYEGWPYLNSARLQSQSLQLHASASVSGRVLQKNGAMASGAKASVMGLVDTVEVSVDSSGAIPVQNVSLLLGSDVKLQARYITLDQTEQLASKGVYLLPGDNISAGDILLHAPATPAYESDLGRQYELFNDDNLNLEFPVGFNFPFYGRLYNGININANGRIHFLHSDKWVTGSDLAELQVQPQIAPWMTDLGPGWKGAIYVNDLFPGKMVITWKDVPHASNRYPDRNTFQVVLYDTGEIQFGYDLMQTWWEQASVGISSGSTDAASVLLTDISAQGVSDGTTKVIYETFAYNSLTFDLQYSMINFIPNYQGGYTFERSPILK